MLRQGLSVISFFLVSCLANAKSSYKDFRIRVKIAQNLSSVQFSGIDLKNKFFAKREVKNYPGRRVIRFNCLSKNKKKISKKPKLLASLASPTGLISFKKEKYKGILHLLSNPVEKKCDVVYEAYLEDYLSTLLPKEMNASWHLEALKAQAVAARSYALHKIKSKYVSKKKGHEAYYDLENSEKHQVNGHFFDATPKTRKATSSTKGEILLTKKGRLTPVFFHAQCGGHTLLPEQVWSKRIKSYSSVRCSYCRHSRKNRWKEKLDMKRMVKFMGWLYKKKYIEEKKKGKIVLVPDSLGNIELKIYRGGRMFTISKILFRRYFGRAIVPSNRFAIRHFKKGFALRGRGNGHGVGMCQVGVLVLARRGWGYKRILAHYFPGHRLEKIY